MARDPERPSIVDPSRGLDHARGRDRFARARTSRTGISTGVASHWRHTGGRGADRNRGGFSVDDPAAARFAMTAQKIIGAAVVVSFAALVFYGAVIHEPWWDEAQAWLIARDATMTDLLRNGSRTKAIPHCGT